MAHVAIETGAVGSAIVIEDGDVLELDKTQARKNGKVTAGRFSSTPAPALTW